MPSAALPAGALAAARDGLIEAGVGVTDHQLQTRGPGPTQAPEEGGPESLVLTVTYFDSQRLPLACRGNAHRHKQKRSLSSGRGRDAPL